MPDFKNLLEQAYQSIGAQQAEILYVYTDFRHYGRYASDYETRNEFCRAVVAPLLDVGKTIVLTTFTYTVDGVFDILETQTKLGALNKWIVNQKGSSRSEHPLFSYAALGPQADLVRGIGKSAFGRDSVFERLMGKKAAFLHVGRPVAMGNTALHYVEQMCGATYRTSKAFQTKVFSGSQYIGTDYSAFLRRRDVPSETFQFDFSKAAAGLFAQGIVKQVGRDEDLTNVSFYWFDQTVDAMCDMFYKNPRVFIQTDFIQY